MKFFEEPTFEKYKFEMEDVITTSYIDPDEDAGQEDDLTQR